MIQSVCKINTDSINVSEEMSIFDLNDKEIGKLRSGAFSPKFNKVVGIAMFKKHLSKVSQEFKIKVNGKFVSGEICNLPIN